MPDHRRSPFSTLSSLSDCQHFQIYASNCTYFEYTSTSKCAPNTSNCLCRFSCCTSQSNSFFFISNSQTLSFLAYMLRGYADHLKPYQENIPKYVIQLLHNCPSESAAIRKVFTSLRNLFSRNS